MERGRRLFPDVPWLLGHEIRARAARGDYQRAGALLESRLSMPAGPGPTAAYLIMMEDAAREFAAHGHADYADSLRQRAIQAYLAQPTPLPVAFGSRADAARVYFGAGRWREAHELFTAVLQGAPGSIEAKGYMGVIAARRGDSTEARRMSDELAALDRPFLNGEQTRWRARIAAALGEPAAAVRLLQTAIQEGTALGVWLHVDPTFSLLREDPQFQEILRPKG